MDTQQEVAFEEMFDDLLPRAIRVARGLVGSVAAAEDIAAEAMARAYLHWPRIGSLPYRDGWVLRVTINLALRSKSAQPTSEIVDGSDSVDFSDTLVQRLELVAALRDLSRRQRETATLHYLLGYSEAQIADQLGISPGSIKVHLSRARGKLRQRLEGFESEEGGDGQNEPATHSG